MYNVWGRWRVWKRETRRETKGRSICKHKERHVCQMEGDMIFMSHVFGETTACPCLMPCIFPPCLLTVLCLLTCCYFFSPFCLSVCVCESATIAAFQYMSTYHRWISQSSSSSVWFLHFLPVWRIYFPLRGRRKKKNKKAFTLVLSAKMTSKMWTETLQIWYCWRTFFFSFTFLVRLEGGNWRGAENCFSVTVRFW